MSAPPKARLPLGQILVGDVRARLAELPDGSIDTAITSPPYYRLRDYGHPGQLGLEPDVDGWVSNLVEVCPDVARVLKPGGSLWLNVGDSLLQPRPSRRTEEEPAARAVRVRPHM